jgi:hypothetical protein
MLAVVDRPVFAAPSAEGAKLALERPLLRDTSAVAVRGACAVVIDVFNQENILIQRAIAHADEGPEVRAAFAEAIDRNVTLFADAQQLEVISSRGDPYRGGALPTNDFAGFDCGHARAIARDRVARVRAGLRNVADLDIRMYAVPFLVLSCTRDKRRERHVVLRSEDGAYVYETVAPKNRPEGEDD